MLLMMVAAGALVTPSWVLVPVLVRWRAAPAVLPALLRLVLAVPLCVVVLLVSSFVGWVLLSRGPGHPVQTLPATLPATELLPSLSIAVAARLNPPRLRLSAS